MEKSLYYTSLPERKGGESTSLVKKKGSQFIARKRKESTRTLLFHASHDRADVGLERA